MSLFEKILSNLETTNYESYLKKFETLNNLMKFIFKREMQVDESMMTQFCNIISKVCINRKEIKDYFHEEILIVMEEMNFDFLRLLLNSLHRQKDWKNISANLIYEYIVKCECEVDYEFSDERKKNPWFQGSVGILGILLSCSFVEIYEEIAEEEIIQTTNGKIQKNDGGIFINKTTNGRIIGDFQRAKEDMRQYILKISKHTQNGLDKLFKSICREIMRDLFYVFTQERALKNNSRAQYNEESNEYQMKTVLHCYKNRLYYRDFSNLQIFGLLLPPEMFMQAAFEAMKWKPQRFDRTFFKYQKQNYPQYDQSPAYSQVSQKGSTSIQSTATNSSTSSTHKPIFQAVNSSNVNSSHKRAVSYQQPKNVNSFSFSPSNNNTDRETGIYRNNRRSTNQTEVCINKDYHRDCEDIQEDFYDDNFGDDDEDLFELEEKNGTFDESILLKYEFVSEIIILCNIDVLNLTNNISPCFKSDKILLNEMRRNICLSTFIFQNQISMVNLTNKLDSLKLFETSNLKKIIFNFSELGKNKLLKLKTQYNDKYEPSMWRPYSWLDAEFIEKLKEKKFECILGNITPVIEKHIFLSDLPASPTFLKFIRNSFHFLFKNSQIFSNILKITYELLQVASIAEKNSQQIDTQISNKQNIGIIHDYDEYQNNNQLQNQDIHFSKSRFYQLRLDDKHIQIIKQFYKNPIKQKKQQSPSTSPVRSEIIDGEGFLQSFSLFTELIQKLEFMYNSPINSLNNIDSGQLEKKEFDNKQNSNTINIITAKVSIDQNGTTSDQQRKQMLIAKQKEIMEQFQNKQKKFQDQNEQINDKSFNTIVSGNNSGNKSHGASIHSNSHHIQKSPYQESLLEQQECVICKTDLGITVIHSFVLIDNLSQHFSITEKQTLPSSVSQKFAITSCQHITHQKCHEMGMENISISRRVLSKDDKEAQLETFCTICKSLSNISVVVVDCYFQKNTYDNIYLSLFNNQQSPSNKKYLPNFEQPSLNNSSTLPQSSIKPNHQKYPSFSNQNQYHPSSSTSFQSPSSSSSNNQSSYTNKEKGSVQHCKSDFKDNTKKILDGLIHQEIINQDKTIINQIYSGLEEFLSLLAIISNNEDNIQEQYIYNVGDSLLQSLLEKTLLTCKYFIFYFTNQNKIFL